MEYFGKAGNILGQIIAAFGYSEKRMFILKRLIAGEWTTLATCRDKDKLWLQSFITQYGNDNPGAVLFIDQWSDQKPWRGNKSQNAHNAANVTSSRSRKPVYRKKVVRYLPIFAPDVPPDLLPDF